MKSSRHDEPPPEPGAESSSESSAESSAESSGWRPAPGARESLDVSVCERISGRHGYAYDRDRRWTEHRAGWVIEPQTPRKQNLVRRSIRWRPEPLRAYGGRCAGARGWLPHTGVGEAEAQPLLPHTGDRFPTGIRGNPVQGNELRETRWMISPSHRRDRNPISGFRCRALLCQLHSGSSGSGYASPKDVFDLRDTMMKTGWPLVR